jgi:hypothetical protein
MWDSVEIAKVDEAFKSVGSGKHELIRIVWIWPSNFRRRCLTVYVCPLHKMLANQVLKPHEDRIFVNGSQTLAVFCFWWLQTEEFVKIGEGGGVHEMLIKSSTESGIVNDFIDAPEILQVAFQLIARLNHDVSSVIFSKLDGRGLLVVMMNR